MHVGHADLLLAHLHLHLVQVELVDLWLLQEIVVFETHRILLGKLFISIYNHLIIEQLSDPDLLARRIIAWGNALYNALSLACNLILGVGWKKGRETVLRRPTDYY